MSNILKAVLVIWLGLVGLTSIVMFPEAWIFILMVALFNLNLVIWSSYE